MDQRTEEWFEARLGCVTASKVSDVLARTKTGPAATRANYMAALVLERITGQRESSFQNAAMQRGVDLEPQARALYSLQQAQPVVECGFILHPSIEWAGASPDGLVGDEGLVEIKVPNSSTHLATLTGGEIDKRYMDQMQWQLTCTGRQWCDFISFDDRFPDEMQMHIRRIERDNERIAHMEAEVTKFLDEVAATVAQLEATYRKAA